MFPTPEKILNAVLHGNNAILHRIERLERNIMAENKEILDAIGRLNDETNVIAGKLNDLRNAIKPGMSPEDVKTIRDQIDAVTARLGTLAADPANPVPVDPAAPAPVDIAVNPPDAISTGTLDAATDGTSTGVVGAPVPVDPIV